jgi:hypothetical protein
MPKSKAARSAATATVTAPRATRESVEQLLDWMYTADALYRAASECCRQHERLSRCLHRAAVEEELHAIQQLVSSSNASLMALSMAYEAAAGAARDATDDDCWHRANSLWHAAREYARRHDGCDRASQLRNQHDTAKLAQLAMEYELEASALLAMQHAVDAYRRVRPDAD